VHSMLSVVWVDNFDFHKRVEWHEACGGLAAGCPLCGSSLAAAELLNEWWMDLNRRVSLNLEKHQRCKQTCGPVLEAPVAEARAWVGIGPGRTRMCGGGRLGWHGPRG
jgi:hypothetical protein